MIKTIFTVKYRHHNQCITVLGVTSIVPNLNGFLFFTEDGEHHFIESHQLSFPGLMPFTLEYSTESEIDHYIHSAKRMPNKNKVYDHRSK